jgi:hypothetical protein
MDKRFVYGKTAEGGVVDCILRVESLNSFREGWVWDADSGCVVYYNGDSGEVRPGRFVPVSGCLALSGDRIMEGVDRIDEAEVWEAACREYRRLVPETEDFDLLGVDDWVEDVMRKPAFYRGLGLVLPLRLR